MPGDVGGEDAQGTRRQPHGAVGVRARPATGDDAEPLVQPPHRRARTVGAVGEQRHVAGEVYRIGDSGARAAWADRQYVTQPHAPGGDEG